MSYIDRPQSHQAERQFVRAAMSLPLLEREQEHDLAKRWREQGDERALHALVSPYIRLVISAAGRYRHYGLPAGDLIQEGNVGLMQAAARFEPERNVRFSTYATWWIRSAMQEYVLRNWSIVRTGTTAAQKSLFFNLRRLRARIEGNGAAGELNEDAKAEIARVLRVPVHEVEAMNQRLQGPDRSLNAPIGEEGDAEWMDVVPDDGPTPEEIVTHVHDSSTRANWVASAVSELTPREQTIITKRRLVEDSESETLETLGQSLGISKERVRQIEQEALGKLKAALLRRAGAEILVG